MVARVQTATLKLNASKVRHHTVISFNRPDLNMQFILSVIWALLSLTPIWGDTSVARGSSGEREKEVEVSQS
jgi:hypothetical protein